MWLRKPMIAIVVAAFLLVVWHVIKESATYGSDEIKVATQVITQYYRHLENQEYGSALNLLDVKGCKGRAHGQNPQGPSAAELERLAQTSEYRLVRFDFVGKSIPLGYPGRLRRNSPMSFVLYLEVVIQGERHFFNETASIQSIEREMKICGLRSRDPYIRYRANEYVTSGWRVPASIVRRAYA